MIIRPYYPANLSLQPYPHWKVIALSWVAKALGIQFHVDGIPMGAPYHYRPDFVERVGEMGSGAFGSEEPK